MLLRSSRKFWLLILFSTTVYSGNGNFTTTTQDKEEVTTIAQSTVEPSIILNLADIEVELCIYETKDHHGGGVEHSCRGRCEENYLPSKDCKCDVLCEAHGDCCIDYAIFCTTQHGGTHTPTDPNLSISDTINSAEYQQMVMSWGWLSFYERCIAPTEYSDSYMLINRCPEEADSSLKEACEQTSQEDPISFIPVFVDNTHYQNRICALCWGHSATSLKLWDLQFYCIKDPMIKRQSPGELIGCMMTACEYQAYYNDAWNAPPYEIFFPRECLADRMIYRCPEGTNATLVDACASYMAPILVGQFNYKNPHCAICNMVDMNINEGCELKRPQCCSWGQNSFKVLFDFSPESGSSSLTGENGEKYEASEVLCGEGTIYDPYLGFCRDLTCPGNLRFDGEACVAELENSGGLINDSFVRIELGAYADRKTKLSDVEQILTSTIRSFITMKSSDIRIMPTSEEVLSNYSSDAVDCLRGKNITGISMEEIGVLTNITFDELISRLSDEILNQCMGTQQRLITRYMTLSNFRNISILKEQCNRNSRQLIPYSSPHVSVIYVNQTALLDITSDNGSVQLISSSVAQIITMYSNGTQIREAFLCETILSCAYIILDSNEFEWIGEDQHTLRHITSDHEVPRKDVIILDDDKIKICNFLSEHQFEVNYFQYSKAQTVINILGCSISIAALFVTILTYSIFSELRNVPGKTVLSMSLAMLIAQLLLLLGTGLTIYPICLTVAVLMQFSWIAVFAWTNILSYDLARTFGSHASMRDKNSASTFIRYSVYGWGLPSVAVGVTVLLHFLVPFNGSAEALFDLDTICWLKPGIPLLMAFGIPAGVLLLGNIIFFTSTIMGLRHTRKATVILEKDGKNLKQMKEDLFLTCRLSIVIGLTWIIGFIVPYTKTPSLWYLFLVLNSLQGPIILWSFVCNRRVRIMWKARIMGKADTTGRSVSSSSTRMSSKSTASTKEKDTAQMNKM